MNDDQPDMSELPTRSTGRARWVNAAAVTGLLFLTLLVGLVYVTRPQTPRELLDHVILALDDDAYGPSLRLAEGMLRRASRAEAARADSLADALLWRAGRSFAHAGHGAKDPRRRMLANDRAADVYLQLGWKYLEQGQGGAFGFGRQPTTLAAAERAASCVVGIAPTRRRAQINAFISQLEDVLDRPIAGVCPW